MPKRRARMRLHAGAAEGRSFVMLRPLRSNWENMLGT
jgi:hypothetical protein